MKKGKLELTWVGKDERVRLEPRVLVEDVAILQGLGQRGFLAT